MKKVCIKENIKKKIFSRKKEKKYKLVKSVCGGSVISQSVSGQWQID